MFRIILPLATASIMGLGAAMASTPRPTVTPGNAELQHTYLVFFESGRPGLTPEGRQILHSAALTAKGLGAVRVAVMVPSDDRAGLAEARAQAVKSELVHDGLASRAIANAGQPQDGNYADADPTVKEWLGRRAIIVVSPAPDAGTGPQARL